MEKFKKIAKFAIPLALAAVPLMSLAVTVIPPDVTTTGAPVTLADIQQRIQDVANFLIIVSVVLAVIFIIWGGIKYMTSRGDSKKAEEARGVIINGIIGAAVVLGVGVILNTVKALLARTFFG